jgi:hypothetical protein
MRREPHDGVVVGGGGEPLGDHLEVAQQVVVRHLHPARCRDRAGRVLQDGQPIRIGGGLGPRLCITGEQILDRDPHRRREGVASREAGHDGVERRARCDHSRWRAVLDHAPSRQQRSLDLAPSGRCHRGRDESGVRRAQERQSERTTGGEEQHDALTGRPAVLERGADAATGTVEVGCRQDHLGRGSTGREPVHEPIGAARGATAHDIHERPPGLVHHGSPT